MTMQKSSKAKSNANTRYCKPVSQWQTRSQSSEYKSPLNEFWVYVWSDSNHSLFFDILCKHSSPSFERVRYNCEIHGKVVGHLKVSFYSFSTAKNSESLSRRLTSGFIYWWKAPIMFTIFFSGQSIFLRISHIAFRLTISDALLKSSKQWYRTRFYSMHFSGNCLVIKI